jgi:curved DNA-binding protein CbpA
VFSRTEFFEGCETVSEVKQRYRKLVFIHHPDVGGDTQTMQRLNAAYHRVLESLHGQERVDADSGKTYRYYYNRARESAVMAKIAELVSLKLPSVEILLVGTWIWVQGNTRPVKEQLKSVGMRWHGKRQRWYWRESRNRCSYNDRATFTGICAKYGVKKFGDPSEERAARQPQLA